MKNSSFEDDYATVCQFEGDVPCVARSLRECDDVTCCKFGEKVYIYAISALCIFVYLRVLLRYIIYLMFCFCFFNVLSRLDEEKHKRGIYIVCEQASQ